MMRVLYIPIILITLASCGTNAVDSEVPAMEQAQSNTVQDSPKGLMNLDLTAHSTYASIMVPDKSRSGVDATIEKDDVSGYLSIRVGKKFHMLIREEPTTLDDIKQELGNDLMWSNEISIIDEHSMLVRKSLPDGSMEQFHFATVLPGVGTNVVLKSDPMGEFTQKDIERMAYCASTLTSSDGLALIH